MILSHIGSTQECGVVLKLDEFSHIIRSSFGLGYSLCLGTYVPTFDESTNDKYPSPMEKSNPKY